MVPAQALIRRFLRLSSADRWLVVETMLHLGFCRALIVFVPFRVYSRWLGVQGGLDASTPGRSLERLAWALSVCSRRTPWQSKCLAQALAGKAMLHRRGIASTLYLGAKTGGKFEAHAWLRSGGLFITGERGHEGFAQLATYC